MRALLVSLILLLALPTLAQEDKMDFWSLQRKGANQQNSQPREEWFQDARRAGLQFVRIMPDAWPASGRDFLIGDADDFQTLNEDDFRKLEAALDQAHGQDLKVVLAMASLPGARWKQNNHDQDDGRLWRVEGYQEQALEFWRQLATRLRDHPAVVAYNPLNEPHSDKEHGFEEPSPAFARWYEKHQNTVADVNRFNRRLVATIREVDPHTPILLDGWFYASPQAFPFNQPVDDDRVLYAFHNPGPWQMCAHRANRGRYTYPDRVPEQWNGPGQAPSRERLSQELDPVRRWAEHHLIPAHRIVASEFWCDRRVEGVEEYLADLVELYNREGWHWAFYAYRSDGDWTGLDYEVGPDGTRTDTPAWKALKHQFRP